ncbi:hypothetical protein GCM10010441_55530 [Kitasatospora paracochleata]|uniref:DUF11 domain-containing protein n=1 Tax=Kitasatospora paracochleata TaxID=58354 RepID=A0ABT1J6G2_9ACTN|nr:hypothetical protein [Kitasatospora paracochleata]MCP2313029.1 hypothetical protein [Kitasatospora paracochleata]
MNASVISRFAKNITIVRASGWERRGRRLALAVPLAAVVAVGAVACDGPKDPVSAAGAVASGTATDAPGQPAPSAPVASPSAATPSADATDGTTPGQAASTDAAAKPTAASAASAAGQAHAGTGSTGTDGLTVRFDGLADGRAVEAGGVSVSFSVTWANHTGKRAEHVVPVVASTFYPGARCSVIAPMADGTLERKDGDHWTELPLSEGTGMDYAIVAEPAAFDLAPGAEHTVQYRMRITADNGPGLLPIEAEAYTSPVGSGRKLAHTEVSVQVVDHHRPTADLAAKLPGSVTPGGDPVVVEAQIANRTAGGFTAAAPEISLLDVQTKQFEAVELLSPADVRAEVLWKGEWRELKTTPTCVGATGGLLLDTDFMNGRLAAGSTDKATFRFSLAPNADPRLTALTVAVGAHADGHHAEPVTRLVQVRRNG